MLVYDSVKLWFDPHKFQVEFSVFPLPCDSTYQLSSLTHKQAQQQEWMIESYTQR
uniref:Uncharacterized protein MANES_13G027500 n=1 Tax=Rhizophora mucronata TaxID=61149 RepID=A0A2P2MD91_RHIMU